MDWTWRHLLSLDLFVVDASETVPLAFALAFALAVAPPAWELALVRVVRTIGAIVLREAGAAVSVRGEAVVRDLIVLLTAERASGEKWPARGSSRRRCTPTALAKVRSYVRLPEAASRT